MIITDDIRLPRVDQLPPNLALMIVGKALAAAYREAGDDPLPEGLTRILRELEEREAADGQLPRTVARLPSPRQLHRKALMTDLQLRP